MQEQWLQLKMKFLLGYNTKILFSGGWTIGGGSLLWVIFPGEGEMSKLSESDKEGGGGGGLTTHAPSRENPGCF